MASHHAEGVGDSYYYGRNSEIVWSADNLPSSVYVQCTGGGAGGEAAASSVGSGGGGGAYSKISFSPVAGVRYQIVVGLGGRGGRVVNGIRSPAGLGARSIFSSSNGIICMARGGGLVDDNSVGGSSAQGVGDVKQSGGDGASGNTGAIYGGGGGAGANIDGNGNASGFAGGRNNFGSLTGYGGDGARLAELLAATEGKPSRLPPYDMTATGQSYICGGGGGGGGASLFPTITPAVLTVPIDTVSGARGGDGIVVLTWAS